MNSHARRIDLAGWKRREHFELYRVMQQPFFSVTVDVDVTGLWHRCKGDPQASFALGALFALMQAIDASEPMRLRLRGSEAWRLDRVGIATTVMRADQTFAFARIDPAPTRDEFLRLGREEMDRARQSVVLDQMPEQDDLVYHTTLPWLRFTSFTNALSGSDSIPRVTFGKVFDAGASFRMPVAVEVHHALVDGLDVARFIEAFEAGLH